MLRYRSTLQCSIVSTVSTRTHLEKKEGEVANRVECLVQALREDPTLGPAWVALGAALQHRWGSATVVISNSEEQPPITVDAQTCFLRALKIALDNRAGSAATAEWVALGEHLLLVHNNSSTDQSPRALYCQWGRCDAERCFRERLCQRRGRQHCHCGPHLDRPWSCIAPKSRS